MMGQFAYLWAWPVVNSIDKNVKYNDDSMNIYIR
jgi:hypothetical protein